MQIPFQPLKQEVLHMLAMHNVWILSTSYNNQVTSRSMSIIHDDLTIYFQTNTCYKKHLHMQHNPLVSLCIQNLSIEGTAKVVGDWHTPTLQPTRRRYEAIHKNSFDTYGLLSGQVVYQITPHTIHFWKYEDGIPFREVLHVLSSEAERLPFM